jgi:hypothetical protein
MPFCVPLIRYTTLGAQRLDSTIRIPSPTTRRRPIIVSETLGVLPTKYGSISNGHYSFSIHHITIRQVAHIIVILNRIFWLQDESYPDYTFDMILVRYIEFQYLDTGCMKRQRIREEDWLLMIVRQAHQ